MSTPLDEQVKTYLRGLEKIPAGHRMSLCQVCGRYAPKKGVYSASGEDALCDLCLEKYKGLAYVVCRACGKFLAFYKPGKTESGYEVRPGATLHTPWCSHCNPAEQSADIEEFKLFLDVRDGRAPASALEDGNGLEGKG